MITFLVPGERSETTRGGGTPAITPTTPVVPGRIKDSVRVGTRRGAGTIETLKADPGKDVVVLHIAGGPSLVLHPETARDLMRAQAGTTRSAAATTNADEVEVPVRLRWQGLEDVAATRGTTRGFLGDVLLSAIDVVTDLFQDKAADLVATEVTKRIDAQVDPGVYRLQAETLTPLKGRSQAVIKPAEAAAGPLLVFVHGTFVETTSTFGKLWTEHPQRVRALFEHYAERVYALDHPTLGSSPIENALTLAEALPKGARLHLVTHSRGGLVAEVLARVCGDPELTAADEFFSDPDAKRQRTALRALAVLVKKNAIQVERIVRVACPARGTLLASKRLDAYVSVFKWTLELAGIPVFPQLVDFLSAVAQRREDKNILPGLEAQIPDSALVRWLHAAEERIPGDLRVVAGDIQGDSVVSWLKTLLADAFYWTDNDLVVQTRSMYGGTPRAGDAAYLLDQGGKVTHFNYFTNERTADAIVTGLIQNDPPGFRTIGPLSWAGKSATGLRGAVAAGERRPEADRPAVFILPGILGSHLKVDGQRVWLSWRIVNGLLRLEYGTSPTRVVEPDGLIDGTYDALSAYLDESHQVIEFSFDWRRPLEEEARRLGAAVELALAARQRSGQPVRLLAHSMGGLLARTMQLECPKVWDRMMAQSGARLLMLGTPNDGSWAPMQVLSGDDSFGNILVAAGALFQDREARAMMATLPGFMQLQAGLLNGLGDSQKWKKLADEDLKRVREHNWWHSRPQQLKAYTWGVPSQAVLDRAVALRKRLDEQRDGKLEKERDKLVMVVGHAKFTPAGYTLGKDGLGYLDAPDGGDGRVTHPSALLNGVRAWRLECEHGSLPAQKDAFPAFLELLRDGTTRRLDAFSAAGETRSGATGEAAAASPVTRPRPVRGRSEVRPPETPNDSQRLEDRTGFDDDAPRGTALAITVVNGDLRFVHEPLMLGHYRSLELFGTEKVVDGLVGAALKDSLALGRYPDQPGTNQIFANLGKSGGNPLQMPRPEAVIVVGLGAEGELHLPDVIQTVRLGVLAWAQQIRERRIGSPEQFELAATLIGSGGSGITVATSAQAVAQGVRAANDDIRDFNERLGEEAQDRRWPSVAQLRFIELFLDRATEAWRALKVQESAAPGFYQVSETVTVATGSLQRPDNAGYRGADYDLISAVADDGDNGDTRVTYTLDTKRARTEVRAQRMQGPLLRELVHRGSNDKNVDKQIGRTLFQLLVPPEMEPFLGDTSNMVIELNRGTAGIPWEMLDTPRDTRGGRDQPPWAIRCKLLRKLRTDDYRLRVSDAGADAMVLIVGEPSADDDVYPRLPGARAEANAIVTTLTAPEALSAEQVRQLISPDGPGPRHDATTIINALMERPWRIVHISGHGEPPLKIGPVPQKPDDPPQRDGDPRGVVLSGGIFLGPNEIRNMRVVPELVFLNCCHLAARNPDELLRGESKRDYNRATFAAGVAEELIKIGVRCVVAAGWAIEDGPAEAFARTFYEGLLRGDRFIDAVARAREEAWARGGNTWAAYQCYGDPDWVFRRGVSDAQRPSRPLGDEFAGIASARSLILALETIAVTSAYPDKGPEKQAAKIRHLEARFRPLWGTQGAVAEAFGAAWSAIDDTANAIQWYQRAFEAEDGGASLKTSEQLANLRARHVWEDLYDTRLRRGRPKPDGNARRKLQTARRAIAEALTLLDQLVALHPTMERQSLRGSTYKRLAMIEHELGNDREERAAIAKTRECYQDAAKRGAEQHLPDAFYPALNLIALALVVDASKPGWKGLDPAMVNAVRQSLATKVRRDPEFWSVAGKTELAAYEAVAARSLATTLPKILRAYADLHERVQDVSKWRSVWDQSVFVLGKYEKRAGVPAKEVGAAKTLVRLLETFVGVVKPSA